MFPSVNKKSATTSVGGAVNSIHQKHTMRAATIPSLISEDVVMKCTLHSTGDIQINGRIEGEVRCANLVVGETGELEGPIRAETVTIRGKVKGDIRAQKVSLHAPCHVEGDLVHGSLAIELGTVFEGNCRCSDNPFADDEIQPEATTPKVSLHPAAVNSSRHDAEQAHAPDTVLAMSPPLTEARLVRMPKRGK